MFLTSVVRLYSSLNVCEDFTLRLDLFLRRPATLFVYVAHLNWSVALALCDGLVFFFPTRQLFLANTTGVDGYCDSGLNGGLVIRLLLRPLRPVTEFFLEITLLVGLLT